MNTEIVQNPPFDVAWRTIDGLNVRYATSGSGAEKVLLLSPWPESIFAFASVWAGLTRQFKVLAFDLPGFGRSEARPDLFDRLHKSGGVGREFLGVAERASGRVDVDHRHGRLLLFRMTEITTPERREARPTSGNCTASGLY